MNLNVSQASMVAAVKLLREAEATAEADHLATQLLSRGRFDDQQATEVAVALFGGRGN